jgi:hypothetical protein
MAKLSLQCSYSRLSECCPLKQAPDLSYRAARLNVSTPARHFRHLDVACPPGDQAIIPNLRSLLTGDFSDLPMRSKPCFHDLVGSSFRFTTSHPLRRYASFGDATQDATVPPWQILIEGMVEAPKVVVMPSGLPRQLTAGFVLFPLLRVDPHRSEMNS